MEKAEQLYRIGMRYVGEYEAIVNDLDFEGDWMAALDACNEKYHTILQFAVGRLFPNRNIDQNVELANAIFEQTGYEDCPGFGFTVEQVAGMIDEFANWRPHAWKD